MDFEEISTMAYENKELPKSATVLEQLVWYKMRDVYRQYASGMLDLNTSKVRKGNINSFYLQQIRLNNFYKDWQEETHKNLRDSEKLLTDITKALKDKVDIEHLTPLLIDYIVKISGIVPVKTLYMENYGKVD